MAEGFDRPESDLFAIRLLHDCYADAVNRRDADAWGALWAEDARGDLMGRQVSGRAAILATRRATMAGLRVVGFFCQPGMIRVGGDEAEGRVWTHEVRGGARPWRRTSLAAHVLGGTKGKRRPLGCYEDREVRGADGRSRFRARRFTLRRDEGRATGGTAKPGEERMPVVVAGEVDMAPGTRKAALAGARPLIAQALTEPGCRHDAWTADPFRPDRIQVLDEWESAKALAARLLAPSYVGMLAHLSGSGIAAATTRKYRCDRGEPVYGADGVATAHFEAGTG